MILYHTTSLYYIIHYIQQLWESGVLRERPSYYMYIYIYIMYTYIYIYVYIYIEIYIYRERERCMNSIYIHIYHSLSLHIYIYIERDISCVCIYIYICIVTGPWDHMPLLFLHDSLQLCAAPFDMTYAPESIRDRQSHVPKSYTLKVLRNPTPNPRILRSQSHVQ